MPKIYIPVALQKVVLERSKGHCEYCLLPASFSPNSFNFEHIIPLGKAGLTALLNLAYSCGGCNAFKNNKIEAIDPLTRNFFPLFNPIAQLWENHFEWSEDDLHIVGTSPTGRATANLLKVNRDGSVNLRKLLKMVGLQPPAIK
jgi:HNH endonuclease